MEGIVGEGVTITPQVLERLRPSKISFNLAKHLLYARFRDAGRLSQAAPLSADPAPRTPLDR